MEERVNVMENINKEKKEKRGGYTTAGNKQQYFILPKEFIPILRELALKDKLTDSAYIRRVMIEHFQKVKPEMF